MKKILFLVLTILVLSGCSAEVNLNISDNRISENTLIYDKKSNVYDNDGKVIKEVEDKVNDFERGSYSANYKISNEDLNYNAGRRYVASHSLDNWSVESILRQCYASYEVTNTDTYYSLKTSDKYACGLIFGASNVTLNVTSDYVISFNNADKVSNGTYTWYINDNTKDNERVFFVVDKTKKNEQKVTTSTTTTNRKEKLEADDKKFNMISNVLLIGVISIAIIGGIITFVRIKKSNK